MNTFINSSSRTVELSSAPNLYSGRTKFRLALVLVGMLSFFSLAIYTNHRIPNYSPQLALIDGDYYFIHNLLLAAFAFAMIPLADFQLFEYNSPFWNIFKSLSTYALLAETESIVQFVYSFQTDAKWSEYEEDIEIVLNLVSIATIRCLVLSVMFWKGLSFLRLIKQSRSLSADYYVSFKLNIFEYLFWHVLGYILTLLFEMSSFHFFVVLSLFVITYFTILHFILQKKMRFYKASVN